MKNTVDNTEFLESPFSLDPIEINLKECTEEHNDNERSVTKKATRKKRKERLPPYIPYKSIYEQSDLSKLTERQRIMALKFQTSSNNTNSLLLAVNDIRVDKVDNTIKKNTKRPKKQASTVVVNNILKSDDSDTLIDSKTSNLSNSDSSLFVNLNDSNCIVDEKNNNYISELIFKSITEQIKNQPIKQTEDLSGNIGNNNDDLSLNTELVSKIEINNEVLEKIKGSMLENKIKTNTFRSRRSKRALRFINRHRKQSKHVYNSLSILRNKPFDNKYCVVKNEQNIITIKDTNISNDDTDLINDNKYENYDSSLNVELCENSNLDNVDLLENSNLDNVELCENSNFDNIELYENNNFDNMELYKNNNIDNNLNTKVNDSKNYLINSRLFHDNIEATSSSSDNTSYDEENNFSLENNASQESIFTAFYNDDIININSINLVPCIKTIRLPFIKTLKCIKCKDGIYDLLNFLNWSKKNHVCENVNCNKDRRIRVITEQLVFLSGSSECMCDKEEYFYVEALAIDELKCNSEIVSGLDDVF